MAAALGMAMRREPEGGLGPPSFFVDRPTKCSKLAPVRHYRFEAAPHGCLPYVLRNTVTTMPTAASKPPTPIVSMV